MTPGHTYRFEVRARDNNGNVGRLEGRVDAAGPHLVQQTSSAVHFSRPVDDHELQQVLGGLASGISPPRAPR